MGMMRPLFIPPLVSITTTLATNPQFYRQYKDCLFGSKISPMSSFHSTGNEIGMVTPILLANASIRSLRRRPRPRPRRHERTNSAATRKLQQIPPSAWNMHMLAFLFLTISISISISTVESFTATATGNTNTNTNTNTHTNADMKTKTKTRRKTWYHSSITTGRILVRGTTTGPRSKSTLTSRSSDDDGDEDDADDDDDYNFWEESLSIKSFNMDLQNLAMEDPQKAQDALEIMEQLYQQQQRQQQQQQLEEEREQQYDNTTSLYVVRPDSASYTTVMEGWCYGGTSTSSGSTTNFLEEEDPTRNNKKRMAGAAAAASTTFTTTSSSSATSSSSSSSSDTARRVQALLDQMEQAEHLQPNEISYLLVCQQWADAVADETPSGQNIQRAQDLLDRLLKQQQQQQQIDLVAEEGEGDGDDTVDTAPSSTSTSTSTPATTPTSTPPRRPRRRPRKSIPISTKLYSIVMEGWCRRVGKVPHAMSRVETLLKNMEEAAAENNKQQQSSSSSSLSLSPAILLPRPNVLTYTSVIGGLARSRQRDLATRAMAMLPRMKAHGVEPDMVAYTSILNCWAKTTSREERQQAHTQALNILQEMEDLYTAKDSISNTGNGDRKPNWSISDNDDGGDPRYHVKPNAITYATAIKAIGNSMAENSPALAEDVLQRMYNLTKSGILHVPPTTETYNAVIMSLSSSSASGSASSPSSSQRWSRLARAKRAEHWLVEMVQRMRKGEAAVAPNVRTWGAVLRAWADSGRPDAGEQAQRVLDLMENWYQQGKSSVKPNVVCYTTVINAWARGTSTPAKVALNRVEELLKHMEDLYGETGDPNVRPNKISYVSAMDAYGRKSKKAHAAIKAQAIVDRMMKLYASNEGYVRPTRIVLNALINAYSKSDDPAAAAQAEKIFRWMEAQYRGGDDYVKPDEITLCGVLNAWANHAANGGALRAQEILDHTESLSLEERGFAHSIICHNILIKAWGRSRASDSVQRAEAILNKLEEKCRNKGESENGNKDERSPTIRPDVTTYSSVINCCAYYSGDEAGRQEALDLALRTFSKIQNDKMCEDGPNNITFGTMLKAIAKLMPIGPAQEKLVESLFRQCQKSGQVDSFVLSQVKAASTSHQYRRLVLEEANVAIEDGANYDKILKNMPREWRANIVAWDG